MYICIYIWIYLRKCKIKQFMNSSLLLINKLTKYSQVWQISKYLSFSGVPLEHTLLGALAKQLRAKGVIIHFIYYLEDQNCIKYLCMYMTRWPHSFSICKIVKLLYLTVQLKSTSNLKKKFLHCLQISKKVSQASELSQRIC